jgi:hypothetical protein
VLSVDLHDYGIHPVILDRAFLPDDESVSYADTDKNGVA